MSIMLFVTDIIKGAVRGYERRLANGRVVQVSPHSNSRGAAKDAHTADLFARPKAPSMKPSPYSDECMKKPEKCTNDLFGGEGATAEQLHAAIQNSKASGVPIHKSILFVTDDLLKATVKKELWIPAHTKKDGTFVHAHHKLVNVSDDHDHAKVGNGQGSHYQKAAHKKLADEVHGFDTLADHDKAMLVLAHATDLQAEASLSAAVSGWKASMLAGKEPTAGQKKAYFEYAAKYPVKVAKMATDIEAAIGADKAEALMGIVSKKTENSDTSAGHVDANDKKHAMTPKEYGAAAFAAGEKHVPGFDQAFVQAHNHLPYAEYMDALQEWSVGWNAANIAANSPKAPKHPDLKTGAVLKLDSQYSKMNSGEWTIYNQDEDNYQMHKVGATVPGAQNTVNIPKATLHASLASGTAKVVLHADPAESDDKAKWQANMDSQKLKTIEHNGSLWYVLSEGAKDPDDSTTFVHLASTFVGSSQNNGWNPKQVSVWVRDAVLSGKPEVDPHTIPGVAGWHASLDAGKVPTVEQHDAMTKDGLSAGSDHIDAAIAKHGDGVIPLIDKSADQWLAAPSSEALEAVLPHMTVLAHVPSAALERSLKVIAHNTGINASKLKNAVQHLKNEALDGTVAGWKKAAMSGKNPTDSQWSAFYDLDGLDKAAHLADVTSKVGGIDHLKAPAKTVSVESVPDAGVAVGGETVLFDSVNGHHVKIIKTPDGYYQSWIDENLDGDGWSSPQYALDQAMETAAKMPIEAKASEYTATINTQGFEYKKSPDGSWLNVTTGAIHKAAGWKSAMLNMLNGEKPVPGQHAATYELAIENAVQLSGADPITLLNIAYGPGMTYADDGPKEGDVKEINGKNYVLHGGRWHLQSPKPPELSKDQEHALKLWLSAGMPMNDKYDHDMESLFYSLTKDQQDFLSDKKEHSKKWTAFLENKNPGHSKFYSIEVNGSVLTKHYGKIGQKGTSVDEPFKDHESAVKAASDIMHKKEAKGYSYVGTPGYPPAPPSSYGNPPASPAPTVVVTKPAKKKKLTKEQQIAAVHIPAFPALDPHANSHQYIVLCDKIKNAVKANGVTGLKSFVTFHNDGTVSSKKIAAGFKTGKCHENTGFIRRQLFHKFCKQMHAAALGKFDPEAEGVDPASLGSAAAAQSPASAQPAGPNDGDTKQGADGMLVFKNGHWHKVEPAAPISVAKSKLGDHVSVMDSWPQTGPQEGSNPGGKFKDKGGQEWYCKFPADAEMVRSEFLAAKFYQMLGVAVPTMKLVEKDGKLGIASKWVDGLKKGSAAQLAGAKGTHEAFAIDAWLGNWDVVGMSNDNLKLNKDGSAIRVDVGGSLNYRAMGSKKGADFGDNVVELKTMKDHSKNDKSAPVFAGASPAAMAWGGAQLNKLKPSQIEELCKIAGPGTDAEKATLAKKLIARRADVLKQMGIVDQWDKPPVDERKLIVNPADIKPPLNFNTLNGGKPVSSKQHINDKNSADSAALAAFAMQGNLKALKDYHYDAVDKDTGQSIGKKPITEHPSNHIQQQWASLVQTLQSIGYPPVDTLEMPSLGSFGLISEIADAAGSFAPNQNVTTIPQEHRLGYFMKLCQIDEGDAVALIKGTKWIWQKSGNAFVASLKHGYAKARSTTKTYISSVQGSGAANHLWSQGKTSYDSTPINKVTAGIYEDAVDLPEGTQMWRWMDDDTAGKSMTKQLLATKPGAILQNTDSMCTSFHESWGNSPHFTNGDGKQIKMRIRCAAGCKATPTYGTQSLGSEGELTTLPGQRYLVVDVKPGDSQHPNGVYLDVIMLPPDPGFVAQLNGQTLAKSLRSSSEWDKKKTVIVFRQEPSRTRQARPILAIVR